MIADGYAVLQRWLLDLASEPPAPLMRDRLIGRLVAARRDFHRGRATEGDLATLLRCVIRREQELQANALAALRVPKAWPGARRRFFEEMGLRVLRDDENGWLLSAQPWQPDWVTDDVTPLDTPLFNSTQRRTPAGVRRDPILRVFGYTQYRSASQRAAVRSVLTMPEGATSLVILPTSAGKSLCVQSLVAATAANAGLTVVVVPTVSLAIDQERAVRHLVDHPTAYYAATSEAANERNRQIVRRIREGSQRVVFTSPEACLTGLASSLEAATDTGLLRCLAIDECHMVAQWGDGFRPAFQQLAGLRRSLLRRAHVPFQTLLLSATVTQSCLDTLRSAFGGPGDFGVTASLQLRPEPDLRWVHCPDPQTREARLLEAVQHLPRPMIVYASTREDSGHYFRLLLEAGWRRTGHLNGATSNAERQELMSRWSAGELDVMVATSAFGLGVDQADVRAVVHACVPETVDRLYQEIGRGGRDGNASLSLVLSIDNDFVVADALSGDMLITVTKGYARWQAMFAAKEPLDRGLYRLPLEVRPAYAAADDSNSYHTMWNVRTLNLMSRAGLIQLEGSGIHESADEPCASVRILDDEHLLLATWEDRVERLRLDEREQAILNLRWLRELAAGRICASRVFECVYRLDSIPGGGGLPVSRSCGGCAACRRQGLAPYAGVQPEPGIPWGHRPWIADSMRAFFGAEEKLCLLYRASGREYEERLAGALAYACLSGFRNLVIASPLWDRLESQIHLPPAAMPFLHDEYEPGLMPALPTIVYLEQSGQVAADLYGEPAEPLLLLAPEETHDPRHPWRPLAQAVKCRSFDSFCTEMGL
jgi:hypothetical protein